MGEVYEESLELDHWRDERDRELTLGGMPVSLEEVITAEDFYKIDPDEKTGEGYTRKRRLHDGVLVPPRRRGLVA